MTAAIELVAGTVLGEGGRYRLERLLGTGGMASVWLARDTRLDREVAIKVLADALALDDDFVARFAREARVAAGLSHRHLVEVFDFTVDGPRPFLVMEYVAGGTLADRLRDPGARTWDAEVLARELLDALGYIHRAGVIHRDIKPGNVLIGADGFARLTDFGIAQPDDATRLTSTGMVIGSARYLAPEVMRGEPASERSDLYSLGVLIEQCLTADTSPRLRSLVSRLTAVRPDRRPASAEQAIELLDHDQSEPIRLFRSSPVPALPRFSSLGHGLTLRVNRGLGRALPLRLNRGLGRALPLRLNRRIAIISALAVLVIALIVLASTGGGSGSPSAGPSRVSPNVSLARELNQLDRAIDQSQR